MSQQDSFGPGTGPLSSPAPPANGQPGFEQPRYDQPYGQPGWEQPGPGPYGYPAAGSPPPGYDYGHDLGPQRTNVMAILGLVFAFVFSPLGIVFSAIGLSQIGKRGERGRGLALTGLILAILFVVIGVVLAVLVLTSPDFKAALDSAESSASSAAADASSASSSAASSAESSIANGAATDAGSAAGGDGAGVASACQMIIPALMNLEADMQDVKTPAQYQQAMSKLETTLSAAASGAQDQKFQQDIAKLNADLAQASATVAAGKDPSALESALNADGEAVGEACATAGVTD